MEIYYDGSNTGHLVLPYIDLHQHIDDGFINPMKWLKYTELARVLISKKIYSHINDESMKMEKLSFYLVRQQAEFTSDLLSFLLKNTSSNSSITNTAIKIVHSIERINRSSAIYSTKIFAKNGNVLLVQSVSIIVMVDATSKQAMPFSIKVKQFIQAHSKPSDSVSLTMPVREPLKTVPSSNSTYYWSRNIVMLDTDANGHSNNTVYFNLAMECLGSALNSDFPIKINVNTLHKCILKKYTIIISRETKLGQLVQVKMWLCPEGYNFIIAANDKTVSRVHIQLFNT